MIKRIMDSSSEYYMKNEQISEYKCEKCEKSFKKKKNHKFHVENIQCNIEDFTINCENDQRTKFYKCNICGTSLLSKKSFTKHYNSVHAKNQKAVRESMAQKNLLSY